MNGLLIRPVKKQKRLTRSREGWKGLISGWAQLALLLWMVLTSRPSTLAPLYSPFFNLCNSEKFSLKNVYNNGDFFSNGNRIYLWDAEPRHEGNAAIDSLKASPKGDRLPGRKRSQNRLIQVTQGGTNYTFGYDYASRRVSETINGTLTKQSVWDGSSLAEERNATNGVMKRFFVQGEVQSGTNYYYFRDHLGSVRELVDGSGTVHAEYSYDAYGNVTQGAGANQNATFQYAGYYEHLGTGLNLTLYRAYDPMTGRWQSRDPIGERAGINLYGYVGNRPISLVDRMGLSPLDEEEFVVYEWVSEKTEPEWEPAENYIGSEAETMWSRIVDYFTKQASQGRVNQLAGQTGENSACLIKNSQRIPSLTGSANYRIPDILDRAANILGEVKNVNNLSYTSQLQDFAAYALQQGMQFQLTVRPATQLSGPLLDAVRNGEITLQYLPQ